jgi:thermolabile hemolysin
MVGGSESMADERHDSREPKLKGYMKRIDLGQTLGRNLQIIFALGAAALVGGSPLGTAAPAPFSGVYVFGDSLSDTGNFHALSGGVPAAPYYEGRFSNGPLWVEYLVEGLGMEISPGDNYAVGGATTGHFNSNNGYLGLEYPGLQDQVAAFLATLGPEGADPAALYVVWAGANDFFLLLGGVGSTEELIAGGVANTVQAIQLLRQAGARHILVLNVPDLGLTPLGLHPDLSDVLTALVMAYNQWLAAALQALAAAGTSTIQVDAFSVLQSMVNHAERYGFANVTEPALDVGGDPAQFLFWDYVHPTTRGHEILGHEALAQLVRHFLPGRGVGVPPARINALHGLVRAGLPR